MKINAKEHLRNMKTEIKGKFKQNKINVTVCNHASMCVWIRGVLEKNTPQSQKFSLEMRGEIAVCISWHA